jgi:hypothetical protein
MDMCGDGRPDAFGQRRIIHQSKRSGRMTLFARLEDRDEPSRQIFLYAIRSTEESYEGCEMNVVATGVHAPFPRGERHPGCLSYG